MVVINVEAYENAQIHTITAGEKKLGGGRVKMKDVQDGLGIKNMPDLI